LIEINQSLGTRQEFEASIANILRRGDIQREHRDVHVDGAVGSSGQVSGR
jgi:hypothetical protein